MMTTLSFHTTIWLPNPADLPRLFQGTNRPYLYADTANLPMEEHGWVRLQEVDLSFELDDALRLPSPQPDSPAAGTAMDLPVDMAPDEGTAL